VSMATAPGGGLSGTVAPGTPPSAPGATCPLCGAPLHAEQEWCLRCGAAARTRLAASPAWKAPLLGAIVVAVLSLGVLAAALVKLAGDSGPGKPPTTTTVTSTLPAALSTTTPTTPTVSTTPIVPPASSTPTTTTPSTPQNTTPTTPIPGNTTSTPGKANPKRIGGLGPTLTKRLLELSRKQAKKGK
jgi:hypothetical protein